MQATGKKTSSALRWIVFTTFIFLMTYQVRAIFGPLLPGIEAEFNISHDSATRLQLFISAGYSTSMFLTLYTATLVRYRYLAGFSCTAGGMALIAVALSPDLATMSFFCVLLGLTTGQYFTAGMGTLRSLVRIDEWGKAVSIHEFGPNVSFILCPLAAVWGAAFLGWRGVLVVLGVIAIVGGALFVFVGRGGNESAPPFFFKGLKRMLRNPMLWLFTLLAALCIGGQFGPYSVMMLHLTGEAAFSSESASWLLSASRMPVPFVVLAGGFVAVRFGAVRALTFCFSAHCLSLFCLAADPVGLKVAGLFLQPTTAAMGIPPLFTLLVERFTIRKQAMVIALGMPLASLAGTGVTPYLLGVIGTHATFGLGFACQGVVVGLSVLLLVGLGKR